MKDFGGIASLTSHDGGLCQCAALGLDGQRFLVDVENRPYNRLIALARQIPGEDLRRSSWLLSCCASMMAKQIVDRYVPVTNRRSVIVRPFVEDSPPQQTSKPRHDVLRWGASVTVFANLLTERLSLLAARLNLLRGCAADCAVLGMVPHPPTPQPPQPPW